MSKIIAENNAEQQSIKKFSLQTIKDMQEKGHLE